jgi:hypothetical protein
MNVVHGAMNISIPRHREIVSNCPRLKEVMRGGDGWTGVNGTWRVQTATKRAKNLTTVVGYTTTTRYENAVLVARLEHNTNSHQWRDGRRGKDGWGRYTRRRKWCRDAELVEVTPSTEITPSPTPNPEPSDEGDDINLAQSTATIVAPSSASTAIDDDEHVDGNSSIAGSKARKRWFRRSSQAASQKSTAGTDSSVGSSLKSYPDEEDVLRPFQELTREDSWGLGEDASMQLS